MSEQIYPELAELRASRVVVATLYLFGFATILRTLNSIMSSGQLRSQAGLILGPDLAFLLLSAFAHFSGVLWRTRTHGPWLHLYFAVQCGMIVASYMRAPELDYITALFILLAYQAALSLSGRALWVWLAIFALLTAGPLVFFLGLLRGLGLGLVAIAVEVITAAYVLINRDVLAAQASSRTMLLELQETHRQLQAYAGQVAELAGIQERNRLAREIHDSVSQTLFSITLNTRAAQLMLDQDPTRVRTQLEQLRSLAQSALAEMRGLIAELRQATDS